MWIALDKILAVPKKPETIVEFHFLVVEFHSWN